ncbi:MAG: DUF1573 domain-containing protein [Bacteroidales bacterium]
MKHVINIAIAILLSTGISVAQRQAENNPGLIAKSNSHNFGRLSYLETAEYEFSLKNITDKNIVITNVRAKCGCTPVDWSKEPVGPGEKAYISISYDTSITGKFQKSVFVFTNEKSAPVKLNISGKVIPPDPGDDAYEHWKKKYKQ